MYKILILYNKEHHMWKSYGITTTSSTSGNKSTFTEFETDDINVLKEELLKLDEQFGFENLKVYREITANYDVEIDDSNIDNTHNDIDEDSNKDGSNDDKTEN